MDNKESQSSIQVLFSVIWGRLFVIIAIGIAAALVFALVTVFLITPTYSSSAKFYVNNTTNKDKDVSQQDINASQSLAETSIVLIKNNTKLIKEIIAEAGVNMTSGALKSAVTAGIYSDTEAFYVTITVPSAQDAYALAQAFRKVVPETLPEAIMGGVIKTFDEPVMATAQTSPNIALNTLFGGFLGVVIAIIVFFLREVLDNTIYYEEDVKDLFGYPVVGVIPTILTNNPDANKKGRRRTRKDSRKGEAYSHSDSAQ